MAYAWAPHAAWQVPAFGNVEPADSAGACLFGSDTALRALVTCLSDPPVPSGDLIDPCIFDHPAALTTLTTCLSGGGTPTAGEVLCIYPPDTPTSRAETLCLFVAETADQTPSQ